jgi:hypothetical protein
LRIDRPPKGGFEGYASGTGVRVRHLNPARKPRPTPRRLQRRPAQADMALLAILYAVVKL